MTAHQPSPQKSTLRARLLQNYTLVFTTGAVVAASVQVIAWDAPIVEAALLGFLVFVVGLQGLWAFIGHYYRSDEVAASIGWPTGNPFQKEIAFTNLAFGALGVLCIWLRGEFWLAAGLGKAIFVLGAQTVHLREIREHDNRNQWNRMQFVLTNVAVWAVILGLLGLYFA